ncbi:MAG: DNA recombination protein RmuC [Spirochaetaceae bacterium]
MNPLFESPLFLGIVVFLAFFTAVLALLRSFRITAQGRKERDPQEYLAERLEELDKISSSLDKLQNFFVTPHIRGGIGETLLEELIRNWLPSNAYAFQYSFAGGARADAVIKLGSYLVAIDSKFPLESVGEVFSNYPTEDSGEGMKTGETAADGEGAYPGKTGKHRKATASSPLPSSVRRSLLSHAKSISTKYIQPEEGTLQFAVMYIPSESVYYRCFVRESSLAEELLALNVVPAGPYSLFLYIQTVAYGLRGFAFPKRAREITELTYQLKTEVESLAAELSTSATHLKNLNGAFDTLAKRGRRLEAAAERIAGTASEKTSDS